MTIKHTTGQLEIEAQRDELLRLLSDYEKAFDAWYGNSGHLCACLDKLNQPGVTEQQKDEVIRLRNLLNMSIKARTALSKAQIP